jgi:hypothetical protein
MWLSFDETNWALIGRKIDSMEINLNPDLENSKDITGASYTEHKGFSPEADIPYKTQEGDGIYDKIQEIVDTLAKDEETTGAVMLVATLDDEVYQGESKALSGSGYKVPVTIVPQSEGGDTGSYTINFNAYENGARVQGTVAVASGVPTFTPAT